MITCRHDKYVSQTYTIQENHKTHHRISISDISVILSSLLPVNTVMKTIRLTAEKTRNWQIAGITGSKCSLDMIKFVTSSWSFTAAHCNHWFNLLQRNVKFKNWGKFFRLIWGSLVWDIILRLAHAQAVASEALADTSGVEFFSRSVSFH